MIKVKWTNNLPWIYQWTWTKILLLFKVKLKIQTIRLLERNRPINSRHGVAIKVDTGGIIIGLISFILLNYDQYKIYFKWNIIFFFHIFVSANLFFNNIVINNEVRNRFSISSTPICIWFFFNLIWLQFN